MSKILLISVFLLFVFADSFGQLGGRNSFAFLNTPVNAHIAGVGGMNVSLYDNDVNLVSQNPALLRDTMHGFFSTNYLPYYADISATSIMFAHRIKKTGIWAGGLQYFNYGTLSETDEAGNYKGNFYPQEFALSLSKSHTINYFTLGGTAKFAVSGVAPGYTSYGLLLDMGGTFRHPQHDLTIGMAIKNIGFAVKKYDKNSTVNMPFDVQLGISFKPKHMPIRLSITAHHLYQYNITYLDTLYSQTIDLNGNKIIPQVNFFNNLARHFVIGAEIIVTKNIHIRGGYNFQQNLELSLDDKSGGAGLSWGFMFRIKSFEFAFTRAYYHISGGKSWLTVTVNANNLFKKKNQ